MEKFPKFSVCMCVYEKDDPQWFDTAVRSILNQTVQPMEVVLVVDGSVPQVLNAVITKYEQTDVFKVIRLEKNSGHGNARRIGLDCCSCELVALMDADDISVPDRFEKQLVLFAEDEEVAVVGGQIREFVESVETPIGYRIVPQTDKEIKAYLKKRCPMNQVTVMFRKSRIMAVGGYIDWYCNEDYYLWVRLFLAGARFANVSDVLVHVRVGADMYMRRGGWKYFCSEFKLQNYMLRNHVTGPVTYVTNVAKRLVVQLLLPNKLRSWVFKHFARNDING